jgi:hypothetical protein
MIVENQVAAMTNIETELLTGSSSVNHYTICEVDDTCEWRALIW